MKSARDRSTNQSAERQAPLTVVADDHPVVRQGLTEILNSQNDRRSGYRFSPGLSLRGPGSLRTAIAPTELLRII
jgi:hypothetical protein